MQDFDGVVVGDARERRLHVFELFGVALERFELARFVFEHGLDDGADEAFAERHHVVEMGVGGFGLEHPEFGEVAASLRFFGAERGAESVDLAERHGGGFDVELAALREIGFLVVNVIHFEKSGGAFARGGSENGRVGERVALAVHVIAGGALGFGADAEDGGLARRANPEVAIVEEEIDAVLFELDGIGRGLVDLLQDFDFGDADFVAARGALFGANFSGDDDAGFLREALECGEGVGTFFERDDALDDAGAVAENRKEQLAGFALIVEPAAEVTSCASCLPASSMLMVVMERFCAAYLSRRGVRCDGIEYRALRVAGNCERSTNCGAE